MQGGELKAWMLWREPPPGTLDRPDRLLWAMQHGNWPVPMEEMENAKGHRKWKQWRKWKQIITHGLWLPVKRQQKMIHQHLFQRGARGPGQRTQEILEQQIMEYLQLGVLKEVEHQIQPQEHRRKITEQTKLFIPYFNMPKKDGRTRLTTDWRSPNELLPEPQHFHLINTQKLPRSIPEEHGWVGAVDLTDAYNLIRIHPALKNISGIVHKGRKLQWQSMGFGMSHAPQKFVELLRILLKPFRQANHHLCIQDYIDDIWVSGKTRQEVQQGLDDLVRYLEIVGLIVNRRKSQLVAKTKVEWIGMIWDLKNKTVTLPEEKRIKIRKMIDKTMRRKMVQVRDIQKIHGSLIQILITTPGSRYQMRPMQIFMKQWGHIPYEKKQMSMELLQALRWWHTTLKETLTAPMRPKMIPSLHLQTDASDTGYGAVNVTTKKEISGIWKQEDMMKRIEMKEMYAAVWALIEWGKEMKDQVIHLETDNSIVQTYLNGMKGGRVTALNKAMRQAWRMCRKNHLTIKCTYIKSAENIRADKLSRKRINKGDYRLNQQVFMMLCKMARVKITLDAFSTAESKMVNRFSSRFGAPGSTWTDTLSVDKKTAKKEVLWMHPPWKIIGRVLEWWRTCRTECLLLVPLWTNYTWWQQIVELTESLNGQIWILAPQQGLYENYLGQPCPPPAWDTACVYLPGSATR